MKPTVLIIDSDGCQSDRLKALLESDYDVAVARSGFDGLSKVTHVRPDVVLIRQILTEMNGFELCQRIRRDLGMVHLHIMMVLDTNSATGEVEALNHFANDVVYVGAVDSLILAKVKAGMFSVQARQQSLFDAERLILTRDYLDHAIIEAEYFYRRYKRPASCLVIRLRIDPRAVKYRIARWMDPLRDTLCELRRTDKIARLNERAFAVLMPETGLEAALVVARRLWNELEDQGLCAGDYQFGLSDLCSHQFNLLRAVEYYAQACGSKDCFGICVNSDLVAPVAN